MMRENSIVSRTKGVNMQVNRIQNNTSFGAIVIPNETLKEFAHAVAKRKNIMHEYDWSTDLALEAKFDDAINKLRKMGGDSRLEMYSLNGRNAHGYLGFKNLETGQTEVNHGNDLFEKIGDNILEGFITLVNKIEKSKTFWKKTPEIDEEHSIINRLTK
jgi:hypothetical protein